MLGVRIAFAVIVVFVGDDNVLSCVSESAAELPLAMQTLLFSSEEAFFLCIKDKISSCIKTVHKKKVISVKRYK